MKKFIVCLVSVSVLALMVSPSFAYDTAKSLGMAGATVAIADDLSAPYVNPAGLAKSKNMKAGLSASSLSGKWDSDGFDVLTDDSNIWENLGLAMPIGNGTIYAGSATLRSFSFYSEDVGGELDLESKLFAPTVAYGTNLSPALAVGGAVSYLNDYENSDYNGDTRVESATGLAFNLGALYALNPMVDLGASLFVPGGKTINGIYDEGSSDYTITGNSGDQGNLKIGGAVKANENLTVGMQFDVLSAIGMKINRLYDDIDVTDSLKADSIVITRIGMEYRIPVPASYVPIWAGIAFIPDNKGEVEATDLETLGMVSAAKFKTFNSTVLALGTGYVGDTFDVGIALQSTTGTTVVNSEDVTLNSTKALISGSFKI